MKATEAKLLDFLKKSPQFVIPIYQRAYSWSEDECRQLWDDIVRTGHDDRVTAHFVGSIVYVEKGLYHVSSQSPLLVIDGQQRLTTVSLLIEALARHLGDEEPVEGFSAKKLRSYYLLNPLEDGELKYKLVLSQTDRTTLMALVDQKTRPTEYSVRVDANFTFFMQRLVDAGENVAPICAGLAKLVVVDISLNRDQDNPQLIFESLNSTGLELSQADLIRNFVLMGLEPALQAQLYEDYWRPMEVDFGQEGYAAHFDSFMRHYLTVKTRDIPNVKDVYAAFKRYARSPEVASVESLVADLRAFAGYYCAMALGTEPDNKLGVAFHDIRELKVDVAYPFLLELYDDYVHGRLSKDDFSSTIRWLESYVFRRAVCGLPSNSHGKIFANFARGVRKERYLESIQAGFLLLQAQRRFPADDEFMRSLQGKDLYHFRNRSYWLRRLENHNRKERVVVEEYTVEHILPQNDDLSSVWQLELGPEWERIRTTYLHTIGNLTLTGYNSEYSDHPFSQKRDMTGGFRESPLRLNDGLGSLEHWNEQTIVQRGQRLAARAVEVWAMPDLDAETVAGYRPKSPTSGYTIDDHPYLAAGPCRELFDAFRKEVLALESSVTEEFLKFYVAYKSETNFVDVVPQTKRLRLSLNIAFPDINDPKGVCRDISSVGRWGNGDVETYLSSLEELPYVVGLVRQSLEQQLGNGTDT